jgi:hypothetical protein
MNGTLQAKDFTVRVRGQSQQQGSTRIELEVIDKYHAPKYRVHNVLVNAFLHGLEKILTLFPRLHFTHRVNIVRWMVYAPPGIRAWSQYMPGAFATYPVHNTEVTHLKNGKKLDIITRNLFRHGDDAIGLRARAYAMAWYVNQVYGTAQNVRWLSLASGTGQQTYEGVAVLRHQPTVWLTDIDDEALVVASELAEAYGLADNVSTKHLDATHTKDLSHALKEHQPHIIDMMGLMEYLDDEAAIKLIRCIERSAPKGARFIFTNMLPTHPGLQVHKRGLGWPGVIVRSIDQVASLVGRAGIRAENLEILTPTDRVYGVFCITVA